MQAGAAHEPDNDITLFLSGDVMTGRGIDQILPHPCAPRLYEPYVTSALDYVELAEVTHGPIARPVELAYVWGELLAEIERRRPDARIVNLETAVTTSEQAWPGKGINYRMNPRNIGCLTVARVDCCVLANNHTLDWGRDGLRETLNVLHRAGITTAGAGADSREARVPACIALRGQGRVVVHAVGAPDSGVGADWAATQHQPGLYVLHDLSMRTADEIATEVAALRQPADIVIVSVHWGGNWGYEVSAAQQGFARRLIDGGVDLVHGHSSHHPRPIEVYRERLILYGCGDLLNDYEGISGYEKYRGDLGLAYFPQLNARTGQLTGLNMVPTRLRRLQITRAGHEDARWLCDRLNHYCAPFGTSLRLLPDDAIELQWPHARPIAPARAPEG